MNLRCKLFFSIFVLLLGTGLLFAQEQANPDNQAAESNVTPGEQAEVQPLVAPEPVMQEEPEMQWLWGEVASVNKDAQQINIKYLDYDTETEKEIALTVEPQTTFENVNSFDEIKNSDTVSIDYLIGQNNKNVARNISVEKLENIEETQDVPQAVEEIMKEDTGAQLKPEQ